MKKVALLIDPDKTKGEKLLEVTQLINEAKPDFLLVGGSLLSENNFESCIQILKKSTEIPLLIFPGDNGQLSKFADALMLLSVISSRNAELLIGQHVRAAFKIRETGIEVIPTGYMLFDGGNLTSVQYMTNSLPLPNDKPDIALATALAGEQLGLKMLYLEAGSGAKNTVNPLTVRCVAENVSLPIFVGGGIRNTEDAEKIWANGADVIVAGTRIEQDGNFLNEICVLRNKMAYFGERK